MRNKKCIQFILRLLFYFWDIQLAYGDWGAAVDQEAFKTIVFVPLSGGKRMTDYGFDGPVPPPPRPPQRPGAQVVAMDVPEEEEEDNNVKPEKSVTHFECSFERNSLCGMIQSQGVSKEVGGDIDWLIHQGKTPSSDTGPEGAKSGQAYLYFEASHIQEGDSAIISIPPVGVGGRYCLKFSYSMYGFHMGKLRVYKESGADEEEIWERAKDQGKGWFEVDEEIVLKKGDKIAFVAYRGTGYSGDIALDDISLKLC